MQQRSARRRLVPIPFGGPMNRIAILSIATVFASFTFGCAMSDEQEPTPEQPSAEAQEHAPPPAVISKLGPQAKCIDHADGTTTCCTPRSCMTF